MNKTEIEINYLVFELNKTDCTASIIKSNHTASEIVIPNSIQYESKYYLITSISPKAFQNSSISTIVFCIDSQVKVIHKNAFINCKINKLNITENIQELKDGWCKSIYNLNVVSISPKNSFFIYFDNKIIIGKSNLKCHIYDTLVFAIRDIDEIIIPSFIKFISPYCFSCCKKLKNIKFTNDSQLKSIGNYAFADSSIKNVCIPDTVEFFGKGWYKNALNLKVQICDNCKNFIYYEKKRG